MKKMPLRYNISSWRQLPQCLSNNSRKLHLHITDFIQSNDLRGLRIAVDHDMYGTLFACCVNARGSLVTRSNNGPAELLDDPISYELTTEQILKELHKYGFEVTYNPRENLPGKQIRYLMTLEQLHYDKIRVMATWTAPNGTKEFKVKVVAFQAKYHKYWLNNGYSPSEKEFTKALLDGTAINLTEVSETEHYRWDWLDYVANINDIIKDNAGDDIYV